MNDYENNPYWGFSDQSIPPKPPDKNKGFGTASLILGIIGISTFWFCGIGIMPSIVAIILAIISLNTENCSKEVAIVGLVLSSITIMITIAFIVLFIIAGVEG